MMLPQRPYFPVGTLAAAVSLSGRSPDVRPPSRSRRRSTAVGLPALAERLDEEAHWNRMLSLGEQQRLGIARALLQKPDFLFLDEATASLDEPSEATLYRLSRSGCRAPPSSRSATARRWRHSTGGGSSWSRRTASAQGAGSRVVAGPAK